MKKLIGIAIFVITMSPIVYGYTYSDYNWIPYNGHQYALTLDVGTWEEAEAEAQVLNPSFHLVTINSIEENTWLTANLAPPLTVPTSSFHWIGFYQDTTDPLYSEPGGGWKWVSGEPVTFVGWCEVEPNNQGQEDYGVLQFEGCWNDWGPASDLGNWDTYGIIETPEPATLLLFILACPCIKLAGGGLLLRRRI